MTSSFSRTVRLPIMHHVTQLNSYDESTTHHSRFHTARHVATELTRLKSYAYMCKKFFLLTTAKIIKSIEFFESYDHTRTATFLWFMVYITVCPNASWAGLICRSQQHYVASDYQ